METGALAMFDALGIRRIWEKNDPDRVVRKFEQMTDRARNIVDRSLGGADHPNTQKPENLIKQVRMGFVSDTVVVGFVTKEKQHPVFALMMAAQYAGEVIRLGLETPAPWTYRGVLTYGDFTMHESGNFFVGPAVDEAARWYEQANAALIWFAQSAQAAMVHATGSDFQGAVTTVEYEVPLKKNGDSCRFCQRISRLTRRRAGPRTYLVSPCESCSPVRASELAARMLATFDLSKPGVREKRDNTKAFLDLHLKEHAQIWEKNQALLRRYGY